MAAPRAADTMPPPLAKDVRRRALRGFGHPQAVLAGEEVFHQLAELRLELGLGPDLQLPRALPREAEVLAELLQRHRLVLHDAHLDDVTLTRIAAPGGFHHALLPAVALLLPGQR